MHVSYMYASEWLPISVMQSCWPRPASCQGHAVLGHGMVSISPGRCMICVRPLPGKHGRESCDSSPHSASLIPYTASVGAMDDIFKCSVCHAEPSATEQLSDMLGWLFQGPICQGLQGISGVHTASCICKKHTAGSSARCMTQEALLLLLTSGWPHCLSRCMYNIHELMGPQLRCRIETADPGMICKIFY